MNEKKDFSISGRVGSFRHAFRGLFDILRTEHNAWIHSASAVIVLFIAWRLQIDRAGFCLILLAIVGVWVAEAFNTVSEILVDMVSPNFSPIAKRAKDMGAASVLIAAFGATLIGLIVLGPPLFERFSKFLSL